jgi:hypothetical protein
MAKKQRQLVRKVSHDTNTSGSSPPEPSLDASLDSVINRIDGDSEQPQPSEDLANSAVEMNETSTQKEPARRRGFTAWLRYEQDSFLWIIMLAWLGALIGFFIGCGFLTFGYGSYQNAVRGTGAGAPPAVFRKYVVSPWRVALAAKVRGKWSVANLAADNLKNGKDQGGLSWISKSSFWPPTLLSNEEKAISPVSKLLSFMEPFRHQKPTKSTDDEQSNSNMPASPPSQMPSGSKSNNDPIDPYFHPVAFHTLREHIIRHKRGYVHPDLGFLVPAPSGAARGIGMVRDSYNRCQINCYPGTTEEALAGSEKYLEERALMEEMKELYPEITSQVKQEDYINKIPTPKTTTLQEVNDVLYRQATSTEHPYTQQTLMMRIPLEAQITRKTALDILNPLFPEEFKAMTPLEQLDDPFLLAILLVHESGLKTRSRFWPYIATLPQHPSCAMHRGWRQSIVDVLTALALEMGTDIQGWPNEIAKASDSMDKIAGGLAHFSAFFEFDTTMFKSHHDAMRWSLCQVASRAIAGNAEYGRLRLVPMMDLINHDEAADLFIELKGNESSIEGHFIGSTEEDAGAFVVRSMRHDRRKVLKKGQELMANYNVPHYSPLDWFINMGYVPPEREGRYTMLYPGLPRDRRSKYKTPISGEKYMDHQKPH